MRLTDYIKAHRRWDFLANLLACIGPRRQNELDRAAEEWHATEPKARRRSAPEKQERLFDSRCCK